MNYAFLIGTIIAVVAIIGIAAFTKFELEDENYDRLKWLTGKWHYITVFVATIVKIFGMPYGVETVALVAAIGAVMAGLLDVSTIQYNQPLPVDIKGLEYIEDEEDGYDDEEDEEVKEGERDE